MSLTFRYRVSFLNYAGIVVTAVSALCMFLQRSVPAVMVGVVLTGTVVLMAERMSRTSYAITGDGRLVIRKGRFSRQIVIRICDIVEVCVVRAGVLPARYVFIRYGAGHEISLQPADDERFVCELRRRLPAG